MNYHKKIIWFVITVSSLFFGCSQTKSLTGTELADILKKPFSSWTIEECDKIINLSTRSNAAEVGSNTLFDDVYIQATKLDDISIPAIVRKEAILKRLSWEDFIARLIFYLEDLTNYTFNSNIARVEKIIAGEDSLKGLSFKISFQNVSNPYRVIDVDDGYDYFFLENNESKFCRVAEISGNYADNHFILGDHLNVVVTFSGKTDRGEILFPNDDFSNGYKLVFNGLQKKPILLE